MTMIVKHPDENYPDVYLNDDDEQISYCKDYRNSPGNFTHSISYVGWHAWAKKRGGQKRCGKCMLFKF